ncbi:MAG: hypothetical protein J3K34DRAFT_434193 [Monoraphidium minutum]|nr:MAG: hypothetical protein J3K34DRAFT_434193 [Monoraphidium minutum]
MADPEDTEQLVLTPAKLRLQSRVVATYTTGTWLMHAVFIIMLLLRIEGRLAVPWWVVLGPEWIVHLVQLPLFAAAIATRERHVEQQLGPAPGPRASAGLVIQYASMRKARMRTALVDGACSLLESAALLATKALACAALESGDAAAGAVCWRLVFLPLWLLWPLTTAAVWLKTPSERVMGSISDLLCLTAVFVALKVDGVLVYSWRIVLLVPWMWFGAIFLATLAALGFMVAAYTCARLRELAMPLGTLGLLAAAGAQLPGFVAAVRLLDGDRHATPAQALLPMAAGWAGMWLASLAIAAGLAWKERLRASLTAAGRTWTADDATHRSVMSADLRETQRQVDAMSDDQLARVARKLMKHKEKPDALLRVGDMLWRRAAEGAAAASVQGVLGDGVTSVAGGFPQGKACGGTPQPPLLQLARVCGSGSSTQEEVCVASDGGCRAVGGSGGAGAMLTLTDPITDTADGSVVIEIRVRAAGPAGHPAPGTCTGAAAVAAAAAAAAAGRAPPLPAAGLAAMAAAGFGSAGFGWPVATDGGGAAAPSAAREEHGSAGQQQADQARRAVALSSGDDGDDSDDGLCTICCDRPASCVFMECGHGGYCWRCAHLLYARPPNECPVCRARIELVLEVSEPRVPLGASAFVVERRSAARRGTRGLLGCLPCHGGPQVLPARDAAHGQGAQQP